MGQERVLADRYTLINPIGRGGMGQVWEAMDTRLNRQVAVKLLTAGAFAADPEFALDARRFTREAAVTAGLAHPGVPAIFDAGTYDDGLYLVMELVDGCTVGDLTAEQGPLPAGWAAGIAGQVAAVLVIAHQREILHRDIKPQNVMVTGDGTVKVLDFGIAGIIGQRITSTGVTVGTPGFIAPEQLYGRPATPQADLYGLGCLLYEMLAGEPVFTATSPAELIRLHVEQPPPPLRRRDVPPGLESVLLRLLAKDPADRPADAREAYELLLPYVWAPGSLGDIDPSSASGTGPQLYARLLASLSGAGLNAGGPSGPFVTGTRPALKARSTGDDTGWVVRHSLWLLPTLLLGGLGACISFGYIAARHQRLPWLGTAITYLAAATAALAITAVGPDPSSGAIGVLNDIGACILIALWPAALIHALWVNFNSRLPLLRALRG